jgi:CHAT domain-containing protein/tetratricopeptide (TPR) repeat protein
MSASTDAEAFGAAIFAEAGRDQSLALAELLRARPEYLEDSSKLRLQEFVLAIRLRAFGDMHLSVAAILQEIGHSQLAIGKPLQAAEQFEMVVAICEILAGPNDPMTIVALIDYGLVKSDLADFAQANALLMRALTSLRAREEDVTHELCRTLGGFVLLENRRGYPDSARGWALELLDLLKRACGEEHPATALAMIDLGAIELLRDDQSEADRLYQRALEILCPPRGDPHPEAWAALHGLGRLHMHRGWYGRALETLRHAKALAERHFGKEDPKTLAALRSLTELAMKSGPPVVARPIFSGILDLEIETFGSRHPDVARTRAMLGRVAILLGETSQAAEQLKAALEIQEERFDREHPAIAETLEALAELDLREGHYPTAMLRFERAFSIRALRLGERHSSLAKAMSGLARISSDLGRHDEALRQQHDALNILIASVGAMHVAVSEMRSRLAAMLIRKGELDQAEAQVRLGYIVRRNNLNSVLGKSHADLAGSLRDIGSVDLLRGRHPSALKWFARAEKRLKGALGETHPDLVGCYLAHARAHLLDRKWAEARALVIDAIAILAAHPCPDEEAQAYGLLADLAEQDDKPESAITFGKLAINALQRIRNSIRQLDEDLQYGFLGNRLDIYRALAARLVRAGRLSEALQIRTMLKSYEFRQSLRGIDLRAVPAAGVSLTVEEDKWVKPAEVVCGALARGILASEQVGDGVPWTSEHQDAVRRLGEISKSLKDELNERLSSRPPRKPPPDEQSLNRKQPSVHPGSHDASLSYIFQPDGLQVILTSTSRQLSRDIKLTKGELNDLIFSFWLGLRQSDADVMPVSQRLYSLLWAPIASELTEEAPHSVSLSLDGALRYIPFAALHDGRSYLIERYALSIQTNGLEGCRVVTNSNHVAAFGATQSAWGLPALQSVRSEMSRLVRTPQTPDGLLAGIMRLDDDFTESALSQELGGAPNIVHIASHFVFLPARDLDSWILLGDGERLTVERLLSDRFQLKGVDLLTLSACETAMVAVAGEQGREVETLPAMLQARGVGAILASLWPVGDSSTALLMDVFYRGWQIDGLSKVEALQRAQLAILHKATALDPGARRGIRLGDDPGASEPEMPDLARQHPFHWAAFVLVDEVMSGVSLTRRQSRAIDETIDNQA